MSKKHTSVIFVHGVGDPRRHVSLSSFLDHFDLFGQSQDHGIGTAQNFRYRSRALDDGNVLNYVELSHIQKSGNGKPFVNKTVRLYEAYWVPESGARYSTAYLIFWLFRRIFNPLKLLASSWRSFPGLRLWTLVFMASNGSSSQGRFLSLEKAYSEFDGWECRKNFPKGKFEDFITFVNSKHPTGVSGTKLIELAKDWRRTFQSYNFKLFWKSVYYFFFVLIYLLIWLYSLLKLVAFGANDYELGSIIVPSLAFAITSIVFVLGWRALKYHAVDVLTWTFDQEKDERIQARQRVVRFARRIIRNIIDDQECEDCILVGHSLGSSVALEALLEEGKFVKAKGTDNRLTATDDSIFKVRDVFTVGSPIDRIYYFFETDRTFSHRYNRIHEEQRLTVTLPPFWNLGHAGTTRVTNFWSRFDPISSELNSLRKKVAERADAIRNVECLPNGVPWPIRTHISYFSDPAVIGRIYKSVMGGGPPSLEQTSLPTAPAWWTSFCLFCLPLVIGVSLALALLDRPWMSYSSVVLAGVIFLVGKRATKRLKEHHKMHSGEFLER